MSMKHSPSSIAHLYRYVLASADMYYAELGERDVILRTDEQGNFRILAETVGGDGSTAIELCQVFLEYAMYCCALCPPDEALGHMQNFAQHIGRSIGKFLKENISLFEWEHPTNRALEQIFQTMNAQISIEYSGDVEHFIVMDCPLQKTAERSGLCNLELARHGISVMCQSMIQAMNPSVIIKTLPKDHPEFAFTILQPEFA